MEESKVLLDIKHAIEIANSASPRKFESLYLFTTENIGEYISQFKNPKNALTVCGSGDQAFNIVLQGATDIHVFDKNSLTYYLLHLKKTAIEVFDFDEFYSFFLGVSAFDYELYKILRERLPKDIDKFWIEMYRHFNFQGSRLAQSNLFTKSTYTTATRLRVNPYLAPKNYRKLQCILPNISLIFHNLNVTELPAYFNQKLEFDAIILSNIADYANMIYGENYVEKYYALLDSISQTILSPTGELQCAYLYLYGASNKYRSDIDNPQIVDKYFANDTMLGVQSIIYKNYKDAVIFKGGNKYGK